MHTSEAGKKLIKHNEGCVLHIYQDSAGKDTIGWGHLLTAADKASGIYKKGITQAQADALFDQDLKVKEAELTPCVKVALTQGQWDALMDFIYNFGPGNLLSSTLLRKLNAGDYAGARAEFPHWDKIRNPKTGKLEVSSWQVKRRAAEVALWDSK